MEEDDLMRWPLKEAEEDVQVELDMKKRNAEEGLRFLQLLLWSSTSMTSLSRWEGVLWMAVWMERSNTDKASLTKMKMTLSWGRSDE